MQYIVNAREMKRYDAETVSHFGIPSMVLMERAALVTVEEILNSGADLSNVAVFCGSGNNGGDGIAIARMLFLNKLKVKILMVGSEKSYSEQTKQQLKIAVKYKVPIEYIEGDEIAGTTYTTIIDAMFGIGLSRNIEGRYAKILEEINTSLATKIAVDIPSGICADTGKVMGCAVKADFTVTFAFYKTGLLLYPGAEYAGKVIKRDIGIYAIDGQRSNAVLYTYDNNDLSQLLPVRYAGSNKGTYGKVLLIAGSLAMAGAACLSGEAAYRMGCGLVRIITPEENRTILQSTLPEAVLMVYGKEHIEESSVLDAIRQADVIGIGSGIGTATVAKRLLELVLTHARVPVVVDADGLNIIAERKELLRNHLQPVIITPHIGEMSRLTGKSISEIKAEPIACARQFANEYQVICVLKDSRTVVTDPQGETYLNLSGNHGMSTAGAGDVLMGMISGLLASGAEGMKAATAGVWIHGLSGDRMVKETGTRGLLARDIVTGISRVIRGD